MTNVVPLQPKPTQLQLVNPDDFQLTINPARVKYLRIYRGWTQSELAEKAGLSAGYISEIERGTRNGKMRTWRALAGALGIEIPILFHKGPLEISHQGPQHPVLERLA